MGYSAILSKLRSLPIETEWVEFKVNNDDPEKIGKNISALSNSAGLHEKNAGFIVWGVENGTHRLVGTTFKPRERKIGSQELESWLSTHLHPRVDFRIVEFKVDGLPVVMFEVQPCQHTPVRFKDMEYIRVGSYTKKLREYSEKERKLWLQLSRTPFEKGIAKSNVTPDDVLKLIDYPAYFDLMGQNLPDNKTGILGRLETENILIAKSPERYDITNLGAILFAKRLEGFETLSRKMVRVIIYDGNDRIRTIKEQEGTKGYAVGFEGLVAYINDQLPRNEEIGKALRREERMYPEDAVRELVVNALIHQDFSMPGTGPTVEIFTDRVEFTNPGQPLIDRLRFVDEPPQSRNELLAKLMRRMNICEERGSGFDKVVFSCEFYQLPAPDVRVTEKHTKVILYAHKEMAEMDREDKIRATYLHACLLYVSNKRMTNETLRKRFGIEERNKSIASRIIAETVKAELIRPYDPDSKSRRHASYVPFWA